MFLLVTFNISFMQLKELLAQIKQSLYDFIYSKGSSYGKKP